MAAHFDSEMIGSIQQQGTGRDALAIVLAACLIVIGVSAFAAVVLFLQQFQSANNVKDTPEPRPARRGARSTATTTQYRPLSETARRHRTDNVAARTFHRQSSGTPLATGLSLPSSPLSTTSASLLAAPPLTVSAPITASVNDPASAPTPAPDSPFGPNASAMINPIFGRESAPRVAEPQPETETEASPSPGGRPGQCSSGPKGLDSLDLNLLSRIDQALASGVMRPQDASRLLQSFGCDVDELLREELGDPPQPQPRDDSASGGVVAAAASVLASPPVLRASSEVALRGSSDLRRSPARPRPSQHLAAPPTAAPAPRGRLGSGPQPHNNFDPSRSAPVLPASATRAAAASKAANPRAASGGVSFAATVSVGSVDGADGGAGAGGGGGGGGAITTSSGAVVDDNLLRKLDLALASGAVRPDQASQLLKSYGCDLEELLREELSAFEAPGGGGGGGGRGGGGGHCSGSLLSRDSSRSL